MTIEPFDDKWAYPPAASQDELDKRDRQWEQEYRNFVNRNESNFYDPYWSDKEAEENLACWNEQKTFPVRVYFDEESQDFACRCSRYQSSLRVTGEGKCSHIWRYRNEITVRFTDEWKNCF
jgi:hypothetical protein